MIYFQSPDQRHVVVLKPEEITNLGSGKTIITPDYLVMMAYTPDEDWLRTKLQELFVTVGKVTSEAFMELIENGMKRPIPRTPATVNPTKKASRKANKKAQVTDGGDPRL